MTARHPIASASAKKAAPSKARPGYKQAFARPGDLKVLKVKTYTMKGAQGLGALLRAAPSAAKEKLPYREAFRSSLHTQAELVKSGIAPGILKRLANDMKVDQIDLVSHLGLARSTFNRKLAKGDLLSLSDSERVLGVLRLVGQVQQMIQDSGDPKGFDASAWVGQWLEQPLPALGGQAPAKYMDTTAGQELVSQLLRQAQSGAYA